MTDSEPPSICRALRDPQTGIFFLWIGGGIVIKLLGSPFHGNDFIVSALLIGLAALPGLIVWWSARRVRGTGRVPTRDKFLLIWCSVLVVAFLSLVALKGKP